MEFPYSQFGLGWVSTIGVNNKFLQDKGIRFLLSDQLQSKGARAYGQAEMHKCAVLTDNRVEIAHNCDTVPAFPMPAIRSATRTI